MMTQENKKQLLLEIVANPELLELARRAVEDALIDFRDFRISQPLRRNGLVVCEKNGNKSDVIRLGTEDAIAIGLKAIAESL